MKKAVRKEVLYSNLLKKLPPLVTRQKAEELLGISQRTLRNLDYQGRGPKPAFVLGRKVAYPAEELARWFVWEYLPRYNPNLKD